MTPILANLVAETLKCSGFNTVLCCGLFNGLYSRRNLSIQQDISVQLTMRYIAYILRQISYILIGLVTPFLIIQHKLGFVHVIMVIYYNLSMVLIVWLLNTFAMPKLIHPCLSQRQRNQSLNMNNQKKNRMEGFVHIFQAFSTQGPINFTFAMATLDRRCLAFMGLYVIVNQVLNLTLTSFLIQNTNFVKLSDMETAVGNFNEKI